MALVSLFRGLLGLEHTAIENARLDGGVLVIDVRPMARQRGRCGHCRRPCPGYDAGAGRRRWRTLDHGATMTFLEADAPRVQCREHGVNVAHVPWAVHGAGHTHTFDAQAAWLAVRTSKSAVSELMRIAWRSVGSILDRVWQQIDTTTGGPTGARLDGLRRIGIDEVSYRRGQLYLTVVVDHDTGHLVWAEPGRDRATLRRFFDDLGPERSVQITHVSADSASWIGEVVTERCPQAVQCADPFHVVKWANDALGTVRAAAWREARAAGATRKNGREQGRQRRDSTGAARQLREARYALWRNPEDLTDRQQQRLAWIAATHPRLWEAYRLKEGLRALFRMHGPDAIDAFREWLAWARASGIEEFAHLATRIEAIAARVEATLTHRLTNALVESVNTKIRLLTRIAFGFHTPRPLIALAMLSLGTHRPQLPGRTTHT
ncbi:ISL3 family transposase [Nocardioides sp. QY071]|uniref:ISL3 family transposase n=1 Tax=Nocardioides sp. QY071 TaxID=3044187 RepID=UPI00249B80F3|nr:ISL3 family transposase [Nocardioides sp. QY071]WGY00320.1 ISL3 family transposase [Nocardioides sp. QY071]WGY01418.1 ISL3 family transposase [Nocardioides sp. QY071]WGY02511.1 ISL3 family transposase [Nocardioides sp. QY071]WGY03852.1 ISL3 family transposase [Nocardioides sp. QY071]WGY04254.1 ISL3 family transposase [Nocardioides sp. QY071]